MDSEKPSPDGRGRRNVVVGAFAGALFGLLPGFLLLPMTGPWTWLALGPLVLALFGAAAALLLRPFGD